MDPTETAPSTDLDVMSARLAEMEAAQTAADGKPATESKPEASANEAAQRAAAADKGGPDSKTQTDTPSEAERRAKVEGRSASDGNKPTEGKTADGKTQQQPPADQGKGSKYAQDLERRDRSWKALNTEKEAVAAERTKLQQELEQGRRALQAERDQFLAEREQANAANSPERYEQWAQTQATKANQLKAAAQAAEDEGDFEKAEKLKAAADQAQAYERLARNQAAELRRNPPPTDKQREERQKALNKEWTLKAATDFPEFGKKASPVQAEAIQFLQYISKQLPHLARMPELVYFAAERAALKTAADRVPGLEKELTESKKRVAELEQLNNPTPTGGVQSLPGEKSFTEMTPDEQFAALKAEAAGMR
ncbi:MAG: hypothetical protein KGL39_21325 [Patescibacteria group bacterium]|nr:hypothetical protein [Patescibacteria group bacterium]